jgi:head-tail adaptor
MTTASDLRHRIAFDKREEIDDGLGNTQGAFVNQFVTSAAIRAKLGGERVTADRLTGTNTVNITVRQSSITRAIRTDWQARDVNEGITYAITSIIDPTDEGAWLEILAQTEG